MSELFFLLGNIYVLPFWFLMILLPRSRWTQLIIGSPFILIPPALMYVILLLAGIGRFPELSTLTQLTGIATLFGEVDGAAIAWLHLVTFDLFAGRWVYLDSQSRGVNTWVISLILVFVLLLGPLGLLLYLVHRILNFWRFVRSSRAQAAAK